METSTTEQIIRENIERLKAEIKLNSTKEIGDYTTHEETMDNIAILERELANEEAKLAPYQKSETKEAIYIINAHGTMISRNLRSFRNLWREETEYYAITIPQYVELYTFTK